MDISNHQGLQEASGGSAEFGKGCLGKHRLHHGLRFARSLRHQSITQRAVVTAQLDRSVQTLVDRHRLGFEAILDEVDLAFRKNYGFSGNKIGNVHLKWAFSEAAVLFLRNNPEGQKLVARLERKHGKAKALTLLAHKLARAVYFILRREKAFDLTQFLAA